VVLLFDELFDLLDEPELFFEAEELLLEDW
jgi:hypothetical protein